MKKSLLLSLSTIVVALGLYATPAHAEVVITSSPSSAVADGTSAITFTVQSFAYKCTNQYQPASGSPYTVSWFSNPNDNNCSAYGGEDGSGPIQDLGPRIPDTSMSDQFSLSATGSGNIFSVPSISMQMGGSASFTLKSTVAETKTVTFSSSGMGGASVRATRSVTFTAPPTTAAPKPAASSTTTTTQTAPAATATSTAPAAPTAASIKLAGEDVDTTESVTVEPSKPLVLSGKTVPNGIVTLTIHSKPRTVTVKADAEGNWSYTLDAKTLEAGKHTVYAKVTDPVTNQTSPESTLLAFTLASATKTAATASPSQKSSLAKLIVPIVGAVLVAAVAGWYFWRRRHHAAGPQYFGRS